MSQPVLLIVEDNQDARDLYRHIFELDGWRVIDAPTGEQGLQLARSFQFDAALVDHHLGHGMRGMDLVEKLIAERLLEGRRIIVCSGADDLPRKPEEVRIVKKPVELRKLSLLLGKTDAAGPLVSLYICGTTPDTFTAVSVLRKAVEGRVVRIDVQDLMTPTRSAVMRIDFSPLIIVRFNEYIWRFTLHNTSTLEACLDRIAPRKRPRFPSWSGR